MKTLLVAGHPDLSHSVANAAILDGVQRRTGAKIMLALKCFSQWETFPVLSRAMEGPLWGCCASSPDEARLAREKFGGEVHAFAAAWSMEELRETLRWADHVVFNSFAQWQRFRPLVEQASRGQGKAIECGLRVNPEHSEGAVPIYDPCAPGSRLGIRPAAFHAEMERDPSALDGISGLFLNKNSSNHYYCVLFYSFRGAAFMSLTSIKFSGCLAISFLNWLRTRSMSASWSPVVHTASPRWISFFPKSRNAGTMGTPA